MKTMALEAESDALLQPPPNPPSTILFAREILSFTTIKTKTNQDPNQFAFRRTALFFTDT